MEEHEQVVYLKDFKREALKRKFKAYAKNAADFVRVHKEEILVGGGLLVSGGKIISRLAKSHATKKEIEFKERTIYDRSLGRYTELKRPLTANEALEIKRRRAAGERLNTILTDMNLLKR